VKHRVLAPVVGIVCFLSLWEAFVRLEDVSPNKLRAPSAVVRYLWHHPRLFADASWVTVQHAYLGMAFALVGALLLAAPMAASRFVEGAAHPVLTLVQVSPFVAYITSVKLWLGYYSTSPIVFVVGLVCLPAFVFAAVDGMRGADPSARELLASVDAGRWEVLWRLRLPSAMPSLFTAARYNVGLALIAAYLAEGIEGLGPIGKKAGAFSTNVEQYDLLWSAIFCMALLGTVSLLVIAALQRALMRWHVSQRAQLR
jgi:NitT/TauT family transport system permease protein